MREDKQDDFLYTGDRNPNRKGVEKLIEEIGVEALDAEMLNTIGGNILILFGTEGPWESIQKIQKGFDEVILFARDSSITTSKKSILYPLYSPFLSGGTYINIDGKERTSKAARVHHSILPPYTNLSEIVREIQKRIELL